MAAKVSKSSELNEPIEDKERHLRVFVKEAPVILFTVNQQGTLLFCEGSLQKEKINAETLAGQSIYHLCAEKPWAIQAVEEVFKTGHKRVIFGEIGSHWYEIQLAPVRDHDGNVARVFGIAIDATDKKDNELLRDQQDAALSASIDGLAILDADERYIFMNEAHARIYGYDDPKELTGSSWRQLYAGPEQQRIGQWIMPSLQSSGHWRGEALGMKKDGSLFPQEISLSKVRGGGLVCVVRDISSRKKDERRALLVGEVSAYLAESMDYASTVDRTSSLLIPKYCDYCVLNLYPVQQFGHQRVVGTCEPLEQSVVKELEEYDFRRDGNTFCLQNLPEEAGPDLIARIGVSSYIFSPLKVRGSVIGSMALLRKRNHPEGRFVEEDRNATEQIANRVALAIENARLYLEACEAIRMRENLMATVSHDLKNPLTAISINTEILNRFTRTPMIGGQIRRVANNLKISVELMGALIHQLLEFEKMRTGRLVLEKKHVKIPELLQRISLEFQPIREKKQVQLEIDASADMPELYCDPQRLLRIFSNLVGNALKFTPAGGKVRISAAEINDSAVFHISDTGIGIPREELNHVFELHWQSKRTSAQGSGLGLAIAKGFVEAHGGRIWAESEPGIGSTFSFSIPYPAHPRAVAKGSG